MPKVNPKSIPRKISPDVFNKYFCNIAADIDSEFPCHKEDETLWVGGSLGKDSCFSELSPFSVETEINKLEDSPSIDVLGMDRKLLKLSANLISFSLCYIFNTSIRDSNVHPDFKKARVTPIFKDGEDSDPFRPSDYRPISVISHLA